MKKDLRIVFMGTPDFAVGVLDKLVKAGKQIVGVITAPDKPAGRGRKLISSAVKDYAIAQNLKVLQPTNLKNKAFLKELKSLTADLQIVVAFRMLPKVVWQMPECGTFNLHASLLPQYRGAAPINWVIINREKETGVTTFFIDEKIDTGSIIQNKIVKIEDRETVGTLHDKLMALGSELVLETVELIQQENAEPKPQNKNEYVKEAPKLSSENTKIDWNKTAIEIDAMIRGLSPYPGAWTFLNNNGEDYKVKIYAAHVKEEEHNLDHGIVISSKNEIKITCGKGYILIDEIQLPGKRKMDTISLLNGFSFSDDAKLS